MGADSKVVAWSIGLFPVQEWIAEAQRSRDLKIGSAVLSWMMAKALDGLHQAQILLPALSAEQVAEAARTQPSGLMKFTAPIPNRASGWFPRGSLDDAESNLKTLQPILDQAWSELVEASRATAIPAELGDYLTPRGNPIRLVWCLQEASVANSATPSLAEKRQILEGIDALYGAVKRTRPVLPQVGKPVGKCNQCGRREAIGPDAWTPWLDFHERLARQGEIEDGIRVEGGERLCATCLAKRLAGYLGAAPFPSTSRIAASFWLRQVDVVPALKAPAATWRAAATKLDDRGRDPYPFLFERTLRREASRASQGASPHSPEAVETAGAAAAALREAIANNSSLGVQPSNYLAVLFFDGDDMGRTVHENPEEVPRELLRFADSLPNVLKGLDATPFYIGGDEGLLLCPIQTCLEAAEAIRNLFRSTLSAHSGPADRTPTVSVGIAIFDRERPLGAAIRAARAALERAKRVDGKNALAVTVATASGSSWTTVDRWGEAWQRGFEAARLLRTRILSASWPFDIAALIESVPSALWESKVGREAIRAEIQRITRRRVSSRPRPGGDPPEGSAEIGSRDAWEAMFGDLWFSKAPDEQERNNTRELLHLVAFLDRETGQDRRAVAETETS